MYYRLTCAGLALALLSGLWSGASAQTSVHQTLQVMDGGANMLAMKPAFDEMTVEGTRQANSVHDQEVSGTPGAMSLHGSLRVNGSSGAAHLDIPLFAPPGVGGVVPPMTLNYNSQAGQGLFGLGWSLSGMSSITRCAATAAQDGWTVLHVHGAPARAPGGIDWTAERFCLDGQRLVKQAIPTQSLTKAEYRTEIDTHRRILAYSDGGGTPPDLFNPSYFVVQEPSGLTREYGKSQNLPDGTVKATSRLSTNQGGGNIKNWLWALDKVTDEFGHGYDIIYNQDSSKQLLWPIDINYNYDNGHAALANIHFYVNNGLDNKNLNHSATDQTKGSFTGRIDPAIYYKGGNGYQSNYVISCITIKTTTASTSSNPGKSFYRQYQFFYEPNPTLTSVTCENGNRNFSSPGSMAAQLSIYQPALLQMINSCAWSSTVTDPVCQTPTTLTYTTAQVSGVAKDNCTGCLIYTAATGNTADENAIPNGSQIFPGDFFGTGIDGLLVIPPTGDVWKLYQGTSSGLKYTNQGSLVNSDGSPNCGPAQFGSRFIVGDFAGSGKAGFIAVNDTVTMVSNWSKYDVSSFGLFLPTIDTNQKPSFYCADHQLHFGDGSWPSGTDVIITGDFGGTGRTQLLTIGRTADPTTGAVRNEWRDAGGDYFILLNKPWAGAKIFGVSQGNSKPVLETVLTAPSGGPTTGQTLVVGNFLGDGSSSILATTANGWNLYSFSGTSLTSVANGTDFNSGCKIYAGNFGGDAMSSLLVLPAGGAGNCPVTTGWQIWRATGANKTGGGSSFVKAATGTDGFSSSDKILIGDFDGDGFDDVFQISGGSAYLFTSGPSPLPSGGVLTSTSLTKQGLPSIQAVDSTFVAGSFMPHIGQSVLRVSATTSNLPQGRTWELYDTAWVTPRNLLVGVDFGLRPTTTAALPPHDISISYSPLNAQASGYTTGTNAVYPVVDISSPLSVVTQVQRWNGLLGATATGNAFTTNYGSYQALQWDRARRQLSGFQSFSSTELESKMQTWTFFNPAFPFWTLPTSSSTSSLDQPNPVVSHSWINYSCLSSSTGSPITCSQSPSQVYLLGTVGTETQTSDLNSSGLISDVLTSYTFDGNGNVTNAVSYTKDNKYTVNIQKSYTDLTDSSSWLVGRIGQVRVTRTSPALQ